MELSVPSSWALQFAESSRTRVSDRTEPAVNEQIRRRMLKSVEHYALLSREEITARLAELDKEWDIERALELNAASLMLFGLGAGMTISRRYLAISLAAAGFLFQHASQGWCAPTPILRRLGFRTAAEIEEERYALKLLRGDFTELATAKITTPEEVAAAVLE